jgi:ubiquinone/menaquinone biosynthesis C-methylase UbiE
MEEIIYWTPRATDFEESYISVRAKEERVYTDEQVVALPLVSDNDIQYREWKMRGVTAQKFISYLDTKTFKTALDLGCGNGWFTNMIADKVKSVIGLDINETELKQGNRVFKNSSLSFAYCDIFKADITQKFDLITLNASVQYFSDLETLFSRLKTLLNPKGEIHILDSPFYKSQTDAAEAKQRSRKYFTEQKELGMIENYHHHTLEDVSSFEIQSKPSSKILRKLTGKVESPFKWYKYKGS